MASNQQQSSKPGPPVPIIPNNVDYYLVIHVATTCDEHGVYVAKDSAEVIELGWVLVDAKALEEVGFDGPRYMHLLPGRCSTMLTAVCSTVEIPRERTGEAG